MRIGLGADHKGFPLKESVKAHLIELGYDVVDYGVTNEDPVDYPDIAEIVAREVAAGSVDRAVLCCGTGLGMAITANKVPGVRAATVTDPHSAERSVKSNNAQVICMGAEVVGPKVADMLIDHWVTSEFQGGDSARKVDKINAIDERRGAPRT